jgi:class 3 adenylate cyclase
MDGHALLFTDLVDSTALVERLGDARAAQVLADHDRSARTLLARHDGREIDHSDGFLLLFADAAQAATFALAYHEAIAPLGLAARAGVHVGAVTLRENDAADIARGAKPIEVEGIAKPIAARVMALARGGQTLVTQAARASLGDAVDAATTAIESHGLWQLKGSPSRSRFSRSAFADALRSRHRRLREGVSRRPRRRRLATGARGAPQPAARARRVRRQDRRPRRRRRALRRRLAPRHRARSRRHRQDPARPPPRSDPARRLAGRSLLLRPLRGAHA